jgi:FkbM family methyltransferase
MPPLANRLFAAVPEGLRWRLLGLQQGLHEPEIKVVKEALARGGTAVDVGAWWGPWNYRMSRHADRVVIVEPVPELAAYLERVSPASVEVVEAAASSAPGTSTLWIPTSGLGSEGRSSLAISPPESSPIEVQLVRLDDLDLGDDVRLLKVDVEGHEMEALRGATGLLQRCRPVVVVELEQRFHDEPLADLFAEVEALGFEGSFLDGGAWRPTSEFDVERWQTRWEDEVAAASYFGAIRYRSKFHNNFVFRPVG